MIKKKAVIIKLIPWIFMNIIFLVSEESIAQINYEHTYRFTHENGLPSNTTYDIIQDSLGYIWIATEAGLSRFNGNQFTTYGIKEGLIQNEVVKMIKDSKNRIWLNSTGAFSFLKNGEIQQIKGSEVPNLIWTFQVKEDYNEDIWITATTRVSIIDNETFETTSPPEELDMLSARTQLIGLKQDSFLMLQDTKVLFTKDKQIIRTLELPHSLDVNSLRWMNFLLVENEFIYPSNKGLIALNLNTGKPKIIDPNITATRGIVKNGNLLFVLFPATGFKIIELDKDWNPIDEKTLLKDYLCSGIEIDNEENIWIACYGDGCVMIPKMNDAIRSYPSYKYPHFNKLEFIHTEEDTMWLGNAKGELIKKVNEEIKTYKLDNPKGLPIVRILNMVRTQKGNLLISGDNGIYLYQDDQFIKKINTSAKRIHAYGDSLIVNTYSNSYVVGEDFLMSTKAELKNNDIYSGKLKVRMLEQGRTFSSFVDADNNIWVGSIKNGLLKYSSNGQKKYYREDSNIFMASISDIVQLDNGLVCISTNGEGLIFPDNKEYNQIDTELGLSSDVVFDLEASGDTLYVATNKGMNIIDFSNHNESFYPISIVDKIDGIVANEIRFIEKDDDKIYLATPNGMSEYTVSKELNEDVNSSLFIEHLKINGEERKVGKKINLSPFENNIVIKFNALSFKRNDLMVYAYRMIGEDTDWIYTRNNETHYSNLDHGVYVFELKIANSFAGSKASTTKIEFNIEPKFSQTSLFKILMTMIGLIFLFSLFAAFNTLRQRKLLQQMVVEKTEELNEKVKDLAETNEKLEESNQELEQFASVTSHDLKSPLRSIGGFLQLFIRKNNSRFDNKDHQYVNYILTSVERMDQIIKDLLSLSRIGSQNIEHQILNSKEVILSAIEGLSYVFEEGNAEVNFIGDFPDVNIQKTEFELIFQNLITNGIKYNESTHKIIEITCNTNSDNYEFVIKDNGIGIDINYSSKIYEVFQRLHGDGKYSGTGIGLSICKKVIEKNGGKIWFDSAAGNGTSFHFTWPRLFQESNSIETPKEKILIENS